MSVRVRILLFLVALLGAGAAESYAGLPDFVGLTIGVVAYLVLVFPILERRHRR